MSEKLNGKPLASLLAAGIGSVSLGALTAATEAFPTQLKPILILNTDVGPLSGKTTFAVAIYLVSWIGLYFLLRNKRINEIFWLRITFGLVVLGIILTFPPVFMMFGSHS